MKSLIALVSVALLATAALAADAPVVSNPATPPEGVRVLQLDEVWRVDTEASDELIGVIVAALAGPDGTVWLADEQMGQVLVYSATGELLRTVSRAGEGPGEVNHPSGLLWLEGGDLAITDWQRGKLTRLAPDGTPRASLELRDGDGNPLKSAMVAAAYRGGGTLAASGTVFANGADGAPEQRRYFSVFAADGREVRRLWEAPSGFSFRDRTYDERRHWFVDRPGWGVDDRGLVYYVPDYDAYRIRVCDGGGEPVRIIERDCEPLARTRAEIEATKSGNSMSINNERVELDCRVEDHWPAIQSLRVGPGGELWVSPTADNHTPEPRDDGVVAVCDVFDRDGRYREQVQVVCDLGPGDELLPLTDGRWILLKNVQAARLSQYAKSLDDAGRAALEALPDAALQIVCLKPRE